MNDPIGVLLLRTISKCIHPKHRADILSPHTTITSTPDDIQA
jgi:hypothetical protein